MKTSVVSIYQGSPCEPAPGKPVPPRAKTLPPLTKHLHLMWYPLPAPADPALLNLIGAALGQGLTALAAWVLQASPSGVALEPFVAALEGPNSPINWHFSLPADTADTLMARAHRALAITFSSANTPPSVLLRLRVWALRCLLRKIKLDSDSFWAQATAYMAAHGKCVIKPGTIFVFCSDIWPHAAPRGRGRRGE